MKINTLSLFSSAGIGELEIHKSKLNIIAANEIIPKRAEIYSYLFPESKMFLGDITKTETKNNILKYIKDKNIKFLLATPPCQGLSSVGKNKIQNHFINDKRNFLIEEVFFFIDNLNLDYILIENVPRFLNMFFPYNDNFVTLEELLNYRYGDIYNVDIKTLNAKDYGIPQSRPRAIIKLYKKNLNWSWPALEKEIPLKDVISHLPSLKPGETSNIQWHNAKQARPEIVTAMMHTPTGKSAMNNIIHYPKKANGEKIKGFHNTYKRMSWDSPAPARTTYSGSISSHNNVHPGRLQKNGLYSDPRVLTLHETFLVSSISPNISFPSNTSETLIRTIVGESIPPLMLKKICDLIGE